MFVKAGVQILSFNKDKKRSCKLLLNSRGFVTADVVTIEVHCMWVKVCVCVRERDRGEGVERERDMGDREGKRDGR